jgi:predicted Zn-dependent protease with MMP-like domain
MNRREFEDCVADAVEGLPPYFRRRLDNVEIIVEDWPDRETLRLAGIKDPAELQGWYHGIPLTERSTHYGLVAPDTISIYRRPIMLACRDDDEVRETVRTVVHHEVAHFFGIDDDRLRELGAY